MSSDDSNSGKNSDVILSKKLEEKFPVPKNPKVTRLGDVDIEFSEKIIRQTYEEMKLNIKIGKEKDKRAL